MERTGSMRQRRGGFGSKACKFTAACMSGVLLFCRGEGVAEHLREGLQNRGLEEVRSGATNPILTVQGTTARCELNQNGGQTAQAAATGSLTLSQKNLTAALACVGKSQTAVPEHLANVCQPNGKSAGANQCTFEDNASAGTAVALNKLLGVETDAQWTKVQQAQKTNTTTEKWTLQMREADLPFSDKTFLVGCKDTSSGSSTKNVCKLTVNVEARASSVGDHNVVTCAYGKNSNPKPLEVEMSTENNTLTIQCGTEGSLNPTSYTTDFCISDSTDLEACTKKAFVNILPTFVTSWWATTGNSAKLTIPQTDFPEADQHIVLGCVPTTTASEDPKKAREKEVETVTPASCRVLVTIKSRSSTSYGSSAMQMLAAASGAAAVTGLIVGSL
ncbi:srs domain-containing protein [Neospora caninum Liverpool]|uniref:Srs domain-containing protein n=1 Tax=Neospora caninum (strain Liverpool) TaxID=572307 RepID=F0VA39_NEOCL|nr:srs domain-containing protein [Neospora caninum Liverpool]CBZ50528.1 srs domain-containing protein [Neospora caninum Liverpool]CEL65138.1 TPA: SRS domain-containing protein [Neospora caninum Liverpool]|eukprot:XP_003880561.1 srs domain-containing protein [Neospora caninum Liverpool]